MICKVCACSCGYHVCEYPHMHGIIQPANNPSIMTSINHTALRALAYMREILGELHWIQIPIIQITLPPSSMIISTYTRKERKHGIHSHMTNVTHHTKVGRVTGHDSWVWASCYFQALMDGRCFSWDVLLMYGHIHVTYMNMWATFYNGKLFMYMSGTDKQAHYANVKVPLVISDDTDNSISLASSPFPFWVESKSFFSSSVSAIATEQTREQVMQAHSLLLII